MQSAIILLAVFAFIWQVVKEQAEKRAEQAEKQAEQAEQAEEQQSTVVPAVVPAEQQIFEPTKIPSRMTKIHPWVEMCQAEDKQQKNYEILAQTPAIFRKAATKAKQRHRAA